MRRLIIAGSALLLTGGAGLAAWHFLRPHDLVADARQMLAHGNMRGAQLLLRSAVQADPARAEAHFRLGQAQLQLGDPVAAEREFTLAGERGWDSQALVAPLAQAAVAQHHDEAVLQDARPDGLPPDQAAAVLVSRAQAQLDLGRPAEAEASVAEAQRLAPQSAETALSAAKLALTREDTASAVRHVDEALAIDPHELNALLMQADMRSAAGDQQGALDSYGAALTQAEAGAPGMADTVRLGRARVLAAIGEDARARADLTAVLKAQPKNPVAHYLSARLYIQAGDWKSADAALADVGPVLPRFPQGDLMLALVKANVNQPEQAAAAAERQIARTPGELGAVKLLAKLDLAANQPEQAIHVLTAAPGPLDADALALLGQSYASAGQSARSLTALRQASELKPDDRGLLTQLAAAGLREGDAPLAAKALGRVLDLPKAAAPDAGAGGGPDKAATAAALVLLELQAGDADQATTALERLRAANGDPVQAAVLGGLIKLAQFDLAGAKVEFEAAAKLDPKAAIPRVNLARVLALQGHMPEALALLDAALAAEPANVAALSLLVELRMQANEPQPAMAAAEAAHAAAPDNIGIVTGLASLYLRNQLPAKALTLLDGAVQAGQRAGRQPDPALTLLQVQAQLTAGDRDAAAQILRDVLRRTPDNTAVRAQLAGLLAGAKQYDEAAAVLREGQARQPGDATLNEAAVALAERQGGPAAARAAATALAADPANTAARVLPGDVLMRQGRTAEALAAYQSRLRALPKDDPAEGTLLVRAAQAAAASGDTGGAATMLRGWLAAHPQNAGAAVLLASLDLSANRLSDARTHLEAALASQPDNPAALNNLAWVMQQQGDLARARTLADRSYLLAPTPQAADTLGWIVLAQGHAGDAVALLRGAATEQPADPSVQYHLAAALAQDGQHAAALNVLKPIAGKPMAGFKEQPEAVKLQASLATP